MTCIARPPLTLDDWLAIIDTCATSYGGEDWASLALLGAQTAVLLFALAVVVGYVIAKAARP